MDKKFGLDAIICSAGRFSTSVLTLAVMPLYLPLLGKEAFGLFGFFVSFEVIFTILEGGLGNVLVKDFAEAEAKGENVNSRLRTFEVFYLCMGIIQSILCLTAVYSGFFSFLNTETLSPHVVKSCLTWVSLRGLFGGVSVVHDALITARSQMITLNLNRIFLSLLTSLGSLAVLKITNGNPVAFFAWWMIATGLSALSKMVACWRNQKGKVWETRPQLSILRPYFKDQFRLMGISLLTFTSKQYPMWILGIMAPLSVVGVYALALRITQTLGNTIASLTRPMMARYAQRKVKGHDGLSVLRKMSELVVIIGFLSATAYYLTSDILVSWWLSIKENAFPADKVATISSLLLLSAALELISRPFISALLSERKFKTISLKLVFTSILAPLLGFVLFNKYGAIGLASSLIVFSLINLSFIPIYFKEFSHQTGLKKVTRTFFLVILSSLLLILVSKTLSKTLDNSLIYVAMVTLMFATIMFALLKNWINSEKRLVSPLLSLREENM